MVKTAGAAAAGPENSLNGGTALIVHLVAFVMMVDAIIVNAAIAPSSSESTKCCFVVVVDSCGDNRCKLDAKGGGVKSTALDLSV